MAESRLLRLKIQDINDRRRKAGASQVNEVSPIGSSPRSAQANAELQQQAYQGVRAGTITPGTSASAIRQEQMKGPLTQQTGTQTTEPTAAGILNQQSFAGQKTNYQTSTGQVTALTTLPQRVQQRKEDRIAKAKGIGTTTIKTDADGNVVETTTTKEDDSAAQQREAGIIAQEDSNALTGKEQAQDEFAADAAAADAKLESLIAGLPPEVQEQAGLLLEGYRAQQDAIRKQQSGLGDLAGKLSQSIGDSRSDLKTFLESQAAASKDMFDTVLENSRVQQEAQKTLAEDGERLALERNQLERHREQVQIQQDKDQNLKEILLNLSAKGYSANTDSNLLARVQASQAQYDQRLLDVAQEFSLRESDIAYKFMAQRVSIEQKAADDRLQAYKDFKGETRELAKFGFGESSKSDAEERNLYKELYERNVNIEKEKGLALSSLLKDMQSTVNEERLFKRQTQQQEKQQAFNYFQWAFENSDDASLRKNAISAMKKAGYDVEGINPEALTFSGYEKLQKIKEQQAIDDAESMMDQFSGEYTSGNIDLSNVLRNAVRGSKGVTAKTMDGMIARNLKLLQEGKTQQFKDNITSFAFGKFGTEEAAKVRLNHNANTAMQEVKDELATLGKDYGGQWKSIIENSKVFFELLDKDQKFAGLKAKLQYSQSQIRNALFGAALTDTEAALANDFLVAFDKDEAQTMITKLDQLKTNLHRDVSSSFDSILGSGVYDGFLSKKGSTVSAQGAAQSQPDYSTDAIMNILNTGAMAPSTSGGAVISAEIGGKTIKGQEYVVSALEKANAEFFRDTGKHIAVNQHFRTNEQQAALYESLSKKGARVAPPGKSYHEKGLALDITNWKEAGPYLRKYGFANDLRDDKGHFSIGETNPSILGLFGRIS